METTRRALLTRAFAEFVVIMVGVLAALAVDEWRQELKGRALGDEYVERLASDLRTTSEALEVGLNATIRRAAAGAWVLDAVNGGEPVDTETLMIAGLRASYLASSRTIVLGSRGTYDELLSTGNLTTIPSPQIRKALADYYDEWSVVGGRLVNGQDRRFYDWFRGAISPAAMNALIPACRGVPSGAFSDCDADVADSDMRRFAARIAADRETVVAALNRTVQYHQRLLPLLSSLAEDTETLIDLLEGSSGGGDD